MSMTSITAGLFCILLIGGCAIWQDGEPATDPCGEAQQLLLGCGASFALFQRTGETQCSGPALFAAECVIEHGAACDDLAQLGEGCARVVSDALSEIDLPTAPGDECAPPPSLAPGTVFSLEGRVHQVEGLTYCECVNSPVPTEDLCAPPAVLVFRGVCAATCVERNPSRETSP